MAVSRKEPDSTHASGKKSATTRSKLLPAIGLCSLSCEPARSELSPECSSVEKPYSVNFASPPVELADPPEGFDVSDQRPRALILLGLGQYGPILA
jgi:hypothetical protein